jgi:hypothetical protein
MGPSVNWKPVATFSIFVPGSMMLSRAGSRRSMVIGSCDETGPADADPDERLRLHAVMEVRVTAISAAVKSFSRR